MGPVLSHVSLKYLAPNHWKHYFIISWQYNLYDATFPKVKEIALSETSLKRQSRYMYACCMHVQNITFTLDKIIPLFWDWASNGIVKLYMYDCTMRRCIETNLNTFLIFSEQLWTWFTFVTLQEFMCEPIIKTLVISGFKIFTFVSDAVHFCCQPQLRSNMCWVQF